MKRRNIALIPAAGTGSRFGAGKPKQYVEIGGKTVLQHTLDTFLSHPLIDGAAVVLSPDDTRFQTACTISKPQRAIPPPATPAARRKPAPSA